MRPIRVAERTACRGNSLTKIERSNGNFGSNYPSTVAPLPRAAWAAARRAIGTRNGEHET